MAQANVPPGLRLFYALVNRRSMNKGGRPESKRPAPPPSLRKPHMSHKGGGMYNQQRNV